MRLKKGDKVKMTKKGFSFYSDINNAFEGHSIARSVNHRNFTRAVCELFAIHGVGTIIKVNSDNYKVKFEHSLDGVSYHYTHLFEKSDLKKLNSLQLFIYKIKRFFK